MYIYMLKILVILLLLLLLFCCSSLYYQYVHCAVSVIGAVAVDLAY
jgi:hypothetical protein